MMILNVRTVEWNLQDIIIHQYTQGKLNKKQLLKGGVHGSVHVHESKYFFAFARDDPSLFNLIRFL